MLNYLYLALATLGEVFATSSLKASYGFTRLGPSLLAVAGYVGTFYWLSLSLRAIPLSLAYAIWCGGGIALIPLIDWLYFGQKLDAAAVTGLLLIFLGVTVLTLFSKAGAH